MILFNLSTRKINNMSTITHQPTLSPTPHSTTASIASIDLIIGPMYAGKTTELLRRLSIYKELGLRCCYVNSDKDTRSSDAFSTHNNILRTAKNIQKEFDTCRMPQDIAEMMELHDQYDVFGIDEAQMFINLVSTCSQLVDNHNKKIIMAALNGDSDRRPFGEIIYLVPQADSIVKLEPFCQICASRHKITPAIFTKNIVDKTDTIMIGGKETYAAVCRSCYMDAPTPSDSPTYSKLQTDSSKSSKSSSSKSSSDSGSPSKPLIKTFADDF